MKKLFVGVLCLFTLALGGCGVMVPESYYDNYNFRPCKDDNCHYGNYYSSGTYIDPGYSSVYYGGNGYYYHHSY